MAVRALRFEGRRRANRAQNLLPFGIFDTVLLRALLQPIGRFLVTARTSGSGLHDVRGPDGNRLVVRAMRTRAEADRWRRPQGPHACFCGPSGVSVAGREVAYGRSKVLESAAKLGCPTITVRVSPVGTASDSRLRLRFRALNAWDNGRLSVPARMVVREHRS
jgi:hypothetical protein